MPVTHDGRRTRGSIRRARARLLVGAIAGLAVIHPTPLVAQGSDGGVRGGNDPVTDPILGSFRARNIGPASMGGRVDDIDVSLSHPNIIYVAYAVSGLWKSEDNGTTFQPVFDTYGSASIGDIAIHPTNPDIVYVGTGEANNRQSSSFGDGIYKTTDGGKSFTHIGLRETQTIARIVIDPKNPDVVYVAALGHLFGPNPERGIYKTTDGGRTWAKIKYVDENTGFTDLAIDPSNSNVLYAASYQRRRLGCCFNGGGPGSALWKSEDAGKTWTKLEGNGLPPGTYGRIALDLARSNPNVIYAQIEVGESNTVPPAPPAGQGGGPGGGGGGGGFNWCNNGGPGGGFNVGGPGGQAAQPQTRTPPPLDPTQSGVFRSADGGRTWTHVSNCNARPMYFSKLRVDPTNENTVYVAGLPWAKSLDGGRTFVTLDAAGGGGSPGHVDQHALWIDPRNSQHLIIGNDGGINVSWNQGKTWDFVNTMPVSLAYAVSADMRRPYYVYIGLQDNGSWGGPSSTRSRWGITNSDWFRVGGGDGFYTGVDPSDYHIVYAESQNGNTNRIDLRTGRTQSIRPRAPTAPGARPQGGGGGGGGGGFGANARPNVINAQPGDVYRFNWNTPFMLSPHNPNIVWLGGNRLFKSTDQGTTWTASVDLTKQVDRNKIEIMGVRGDRTMLSKHDGVTWFSTITALDESPAVPGIVWVGTDDGNLQVTRDGGVTFTEVGKNLPGLPRNHMYWISRIDASHFDPATAYVAVDGHRSDDLKPYLFVTRDYGATWQNISNNLPAYGNIQVVREDPRNKDLLYVGTEFGLFFSLNGGREWKKFTNNFPTVRVDDILIHPRDWDLIVGTHGRSVYIIDDITPLQQLTPTVLASDATLFDIRPAVAYLNDIRLNQQIAGQKVFTAENAPRGTAISYYLKAPAAGGAKVSIADASGRVVRTLEGPAAAGINRVQWDLAPTPRQGGGGGFGGGGGNVPMVDPGTYTVTVSVGGKTLTKPVVVLEDKWMHER